MSGEVKERLVKGVVQLVELERKGEARHTQSTAQLVHVMLALNFYSSSFEDLFLKESERYFREEAESKI